MKTYNKIIATLGLCILTSTTLNAQTVTTTTVVVEQTDTVKSNNKSFTILGERESNNNRYPLVFGGLTFSRIDWRLSRIMDDGAFSLSDENQFLKYKKASNFGFDIAQFGLRASDNFKTYISAGFEWNYLRLENNILLNENTSPISYTEIDPNDTDYSKNVFTTTYLRMPLTFEWRSDKNRKGERVKVAFGAMTGVLLKGTQRLKSKENGKQKFKD